jgi:hypothetical protein
MHNIKGKVTGIQQRENTGVVQIVETGKDKKPVVTAILSFTDPKEAAKYTIGSNVSLTVAPEKK